MKNTLLAFPFIIWTEALFAQFSSMRQVRESDPADSVRVVAEVSAHLKLTHVKPSTIYKVQTKSMTLVPDEKPKDYRCLPKGRMSLLINTNPDPYAVVQPHVFFEISGLPTHLSTKMAVGVMDRNIGFAVGVFTGQYMRRVDDYGDVTYRAKQFESGWHRGLYLFADRPEFVLFFSYAREKTYHYFDTSIGWKAGEMLRLGPLASGFGVQAEFESYLGAGGGLSYRLPSGRFSASVSYLVPGLDEINRERAVGLIVENGILLRLRALCF